MKRVGPGDVLRFETLIPEVQNPNQRCARGGAVEEQDVNSDERRTKRMRAETDKGALYHEYDLLTHQFIAHFRRIHPKNKTIEKEVAGMGKIPVQAANPLAPPGVPLYYVHSRVGYYNDMFFMFWDSVIAEALATIAPWFTIDSKRALDRLFALEFER